MNDDLKEGKMGCDSENHKEHMCALSAANRIEQIRCLSDKSTVECANCGAKANSPENVCSPVELPDIAWMGDGADVKL